MTWIPVEFSFEALLFQTPRHRMKDGAVREVSVDEYNLHSLEYELCRGFVSSYLFYTKKNADLDGRRVEQRGLEPLTS